MLFLDTLTGIMHKTHLLSSTWILEAPEDISRRTYKEKLQHDNVSKKLRKPAEKRENLLTR